MDFNSVEFAKKVFPEGCKYYPQSDLSFGTIIVLSEVGHQVSRSYKKKKIPNNRYEHVCYGCDEKGCGSRQVERHNGKKRWAYL